jgi:hypothetical protein
VGSSPTIGTNCQLDQLLPEVCSFPGFGRVLRVTVSIFVDLPELLIPITADGAYVLFHLDITPREDDDSGNQSILQTPDCWSVVVLESGGLGNNTKSFV